MTGYTFAEPGQRDLLGPDLDLLPSLADQIAALDRAKATGDVEEYVITWLSISDQNGGGSSAWWGNDDPPEAPPELKSWIACDSQEAARQDRWKALHDHHETVDGFRPTLERELLRCGRFIDNRRVSLKEIKAVVRAFLATNGRLLLVPPAHDRRRRRIEVSVDTFRLSSRDWTEVDARASSAMMRLVRRWRAEPALERIIQKLGVSLPNGWVVLGAKK